MVKNHHRTLRSLLDVYEDSRYTQEKKMNWLADKMEAPGKVRIACIATLTHPSFSFSDCPFKEKLSLEAHARGPCGSEKSPQLALPAPLTLFLNQNRHPLKQKTNKQGRQFKALSTKIYQCLMVDDPNFLINDKEPSSSGGGGGGGGGKKKE